VTIELDDPYETPSDADIVVDVSKQTVPEIVHSTSNQLFRMFCETDCFEGIVLLIETHGLI
jgi:adenylylsulfate kinase-like enzyme